MAVIGSFGNTSLKNQPITLILADGTKMKITITIIVQLKIYKVILSIILVFISLAQFNYLCLAKE